ncbi:MAG: SPOR domain-containing protein [Roseiarcus sp.]|jgi:hypothetical protein
MSVSSAGKVPEINLDEFERRLRSAGAAPSGADDPLAELTRLVTMISRDGVAGDPLAPPPARMPKAASVFPTGGAVAGRFGSAPGPARFAAARAPSRALDDFDFAAARDAAPSAAFEEDRPRTRRPRSWYFATAGLAAIGLALLAGAATLKMGAPSANKRPPFIAAAEGPSKIQPPSDAAARSGGDSAGLLMKDSATGAPVKIVVTEEKPLAVAAGSPVAAAVQTPIVAPAGPSTTVAPLFPDANPVKTVSVRPDGTLISVDSAPPPPPALAALGAARAVDTAPVGATAAPAAAAGEPATPKLDLPTKLSPKSSARLIARTDAAPAAAADATPTAPLQLAAPAAATKAAKTPPAKAAPAVADALAAPADAAASEPAAAGGGWAVQFAAPRSQADAQNVIARLKGKYAAALGDADLAVREAEVKGDTIYRVRADGLSREDAASLCAKVRASGGDCFIAKN